MPWLQLWEYGKTASVICTAFGIIWGTYSNSGLPVPVTMQQMEKRFTVVTDQIKSMKVIVLESQRSQLQTSRMLLRSQRMALEEAVKVAEPENKFVINGRIGQIGDELAELDKKEQALSRKIEELTHGNNL